MEERKKGRKEQKRLERGRKEKGRKKRKKERRKEEKKGGWKEGGKERRQPSDLYIRVHILNEIQILTVKGYGPYTILGPL